MSQFYDDAVALALSQITEFGRTVTFARFTRTNDPVVGGQTSVVAAKAEPVALVLPVSKTDAKGLDNKLIEALTAGRLRKLLLPAFAYEPEATDYFVFDSMYWIVRGSTPLNPAGTTILHTAFVEKTTLSALDIAALSA